MKKLLALVLALFCISSVTAYATTPVGPETVDVTGQLSYDTVYEIDIENEREGLYVNGEYYTLFNAKNMETNGYDEFQYEISMSDELEQKIQDVELCISPDLAVVYSTYNFGDGTSLNATYLKHSLVSEYDRLVSNEWQYGEIEFEYPHDNQLSITQEKLYGKQVNLFTKEIEDYNYHEFRVYSITNSCKIKVEKGMLITTEDKYYFIDYEKANLGDFDYFNIADYSEILAFEITDENLCNKIDECIEAYYDDEFGFFDDDGFTNAVSKVMLTIMFLIFPLAVFVFSLILAIRSKGYYKKIFRVLYISAIVTLVLVVVLFLTL